MIEKICEELDLDTKDLLILELSNRIDKVINILDNFDAWLEPQDTLKIRKCIEILKGENND